MQHLFIQYLNEQPIKIYFQLNLMKKLRINNILSIQISKKTNGRKKGKIFIKRIFKKKDCKNREKKYIYNGLDINIL